MKMANLAQMVNVIAPIMTTEEGYFLQPTAVAPDLDPPGAIVSKPLRAGGEGSAGPYLGRLASFLSSQFAP